MTSCNTPRPRSVNKLQSRDTRSSTRVLTSSSAAGILPGREDHRRIRRGVVFEPKVTFDYLASLEWSRAAENTCLIGPAGTDKSHISRGAGRRRRRSRTSGAVLHRRGARRNALSSTRRQQRRQSARRPATQRLDHLRRTRLRATRRHRNPAPLLIDPIVGVTGAGTVGGVRPPNTGSLWRPLRDHRRLSGGPRDSQAAVSDPLVTARRRTKFRSPPE
jgi:hypothetical protein